MLNQYKNLNQILNANYPLIGDRFDLTAHNLIDDAIFYKEVPKPSITNGQVELHIYSNQTWITGNHNVTVQDNVQLYDSDGNLIDLGSYPIGIKILKELSDLKLNSGNFRIVVNFFKNLIGNYNNPFIFIDEISPDRTELKLRITKLDDVINKLQVTDFIRTVHQVNPTTLEPKFVSHQIQESMHKTYLLNFSRNKIVKFINSVVIDGEYLYVKLQDPAPDFITPKLKCWVTEELRYPYIDRISLQELLQEITYNHLSGANWDAYQSYNVSSETGIKNWNDLLGSSIQTSQQIVDSYFSGSLAGIKLNIDYSDFNNFIFYSSAEERLHNFKYKLELLEYYTNQINALTSISGSTATTNIADYTSNKTKLIGGFDSFENYLYYQSSSKLHTYDLPHESPNVAAVTGSYVMPVPKSNSTYPYTLYPVTSSQFETWYDNLITSASYYDSLNLNKLVNTLPQSLLTDETNIDLFTFVNMLGHHYDILYTYINHMSTINKRDENPKLGMPSELLYSVAKQFGWSLQDGSQHHDLWQYTLGTNSTGVPLTGSNTVGDPSVPSREMTHAIWRRIVNNLPLLLKTKGTKRSVQALLSCYGIPQSLISINEYGGPNSDNIPVYEKLSFDYALDLINNSTGTININYTTTVNALELRFRTDNVITFPTLPSTMNLISISGSSLDVILNYTRGTLGTITITDSVTSNSSTTNEIELFDGSWLSMLVRKNGTNLDLYVKKSKYGNIVAAVSASITGSIPKPGLVKLGVTSTGASRFRGQLQELRLWSSSLNVTAFDTHVKAPAVYVGNVNAYDELLYRLPLTQKINHSLTSSLFGVQPVSSSISASFSNWSNNLPYDSVEETHYYESLTVGFNTYNDNKIRIESNTLNGSLDVKTRSEVSQYGNGPTDSSLVGVYYSPQTMIDEDIMAHMGYVNLSDYIGDIDNTNKTSYPALQDFANRYWKKRQTKNDINAYIKMFTAFDMSFFNQLDQLLPARANNLTGVVIQPTLLERSKDTVLPNIGYKHNTFQTVVGMPIGINGTNTNIYGSVNISPTISNVTIATRTPGPGSALGSSLPNPITPLRGISIPAIQYPAGPPPLTPSQTPPPYWVTNPIVNVTSSTMHPDKLSYTLFTSGGLLYRAYKISEANVYWPLGTMNHNYGGSKLTSPGFNLPSPDTWNGKPVVEIIKTNPATIIYEGGTRNSGAFTFTRPNSRPIWNYASLARTSRAIYTPANTTTAYNPSLYE